MHQNDIIRRFGIENSNYLERYAAACEFYANRVFDTTLVYYEKHHIFPKSIFGDNAHLIKVTYYEHLKLHWLLWEAYRET